MQQSRQPVCEELDDGNAIESGGKAYKIIELNSSHTSVDARDDFLGDGNRINMLGIEAVTQS
jgi:hypothetical protein